MHAKLAYDKDSGKADADLGARATRSAATRLLGDGGTPHARCGLVRASCPASRDRAPTRRVPSGCLGLAEHVAAVRQGRTARRWTSRTTAEVESRTTCAIVAVTS